MAMNKTRLSLTVGLSLLSTAYLSMSLPIHEIYGDTKEATATYSFDDYNESITAVYNSDNNILEHTEYNSYIFEEGKVGNCLYLDGTLGLKLDISNIASENYSVSFWVKPTEITAHSPIFSLVKGDFSQQNYSSVISDENWLQPNITGLYTDDSGTISYSAGIAGALTTDMWTQITITVDGDASNEANFDQMNLYIDGEFICSGLVTDNLLDSFSQCYVGIDAANHPFNGYIDELHIFNSCLSAVEIADLFESENSSSNKDHEHSGRPDGGNNKLPGSQNHNQAGNIFDDITELDQGSLPDTSNSALSSYLNPGLAEGMEYQTDVYAETALTLAAIFLVMGICFFLTFIKKKRNQY